MRRAALLTTLLVLFGAAPAGAWFEAAERDVPGDAPAVCLRGAGLADVSLLEATTRRSFTNALLGVDAHAFALRSTTRIARPADCPAVATSDGAVPLVAGWSGVPGRRFTAALRVGPTTIRTAARRIPTAPVVAVAPGGAAVVAWTERPLAALDRPRVYATVRPHPDAPFGPVTQLGAAAGDFRVLVAAGVDGAGRATVAWLRDMRPHGLLTEELLVATSQADGRFSPGLRLAHGFGGRVALTVLPDGRTLLASDVGGALRTYERPSADAPFAPARVSEADGAEDLAVALAPDGGAVVALRTLEGSVGVALRPPGGRFGELELLAPRERETRGSSITVFAAGPLPDDAAGRALRAALGPNGEVAVSWVDDARDGAAATARAAHGTLASGMERTRRLGSPCRSAVGTAPVALPDGRLGVAWADNVRVRTIATSTTPRGGGRLHLARTTAAGEAIPAPLLAAPRITARVVGPRALQPGLPLRVRVHCEGACDVHVAARARGVRGGDRGFGGDDGYGTPMWVASSVSLPAGASRVVRVEPLWGFNAAGVRDRPRGPIVVTACAPDGPLAQRFELSPPRIADPPPFPRVLDLAAVRRNDAIRVTWRTAAPAVRAEFSVGTSPGNAYAQRHGRGRTRFAVTLRASERPARRVEVTVATPAVSFPVSYRAPVS